MAIRFAEEFKTEFHFAKNKDRGFTVITSILQDKQELKFESLLEYPDVIKVELNSALQPNETYKIHLNYIVQIPNDKFTNYGVTSFGEYNLRYWYITPVVYNGSWQYYSNKNLDDLYIPESEVRINLVCPSNFVVTTELNELYKTENNGVKNIGFEGKHRNNDKLFLHKIPDFKSVKTDYLTVVSNIEDKGLPPVDKAMITDRVIHFIIKNLGVQYNNFQYEIKILKTALHNYLENTLFTNPRNEQWLTDGLQTYFMMKYVEENYPNMKIFGKLSYAWGIRSMHAAKLKFNDQYNFLYMHMARSNLDQPLTMAKDSLLKFNENIANKYKAGVGLKYLDDYINSGIFEKTVKEYLENNKLKTTSPQEFETLIKSKTEKDVDWFFDEFISTNKKIDFKINKTSQTIDSITLFIKNKRKNSMPISLFAMNDDSIISKTWVTNINGTKKVTIPNENINKLVLNYDKTIPEYNLRDNWKSLKGIFFNNKPVQFRFFKDIEDPYYNQIFFMPIFGYNYYDGFSAGLKMYNKSILPKSFTYSINPTYGFKSKQLVGSGSVIYSQRLENQDLYLANYGLFGEYANYAPDLSYTTITPFISLNFRDHNDLRNNKREYLNFRYLKIDKEFDENNVSNASTDPAYSVLDINYGHTNKNLINFSSWFTDLQFSKDFGKLSFNYEYRKLTENNQQINLRLFAGAFLYNNTYQNSDYFSFALDRPTDYLFDYNYLGRSEDSGIFSQQLIIAEGGFKSKLETPYANQWITTLNASTTLWKYIQVYGDLGFVKNHSFSPEFVYDSGIRLSLVADYFELYFPVYSNLGWEIAQPNYQEKIRFIITFSPKTLYGLFTRRWY
ncbi:MAG: metalloprotease [Flavobacteriaceae bacterium]